MRWTRMCRLLALACALLGAASVAAAQHTGHGPPSPAPTAPVQPQPEPAGSDHGAHGADTQVPKEPIPPVTDADRAAAFPPSLEGHAVHDSVVNYFVLFDQLEWQGGTAGGVNLENTTWIGGDVNRAWFRAESESEDGRQESTFVHALYGRSFTRWWDVVAGVRQDFAPGNQQTWAAFGVQGLAPYWFEVEATGYVGAGGRTQVRVEVEYELLLTNRLILQPLVELEVYGKADPARELGAGLGSLETGLRLRYEFRRQFAPYIGLTWDRKFFGTARFAREAGEPIGGARLAAGVRLWL